MKHIFVINPAAGQGKSLNFIKPEIEKICAKYSLDYEIHVTEKQGEGIEYVKNRAESGERVPRRPSGPPRHYRLGPDQRPGPPGGKPHP